MVIRKLKKITTWLRALRDRRGGCGTRSGRSASLGDFGMNGPLPGWVSASRPKETPLFWLPPFWLLSVTGNPSLFRIRGCFVQQCGKIRVVVRRGRAGRWDDFYTQTVAAGKSMPLSSRAITGG